jgi:LmbE family N-acetylglucosaminyl deacetylase
MKKYIFSVVLAMLFTFSKAQAPKKLSSSEIFQHIKALNFLGNVLYIAAHPDDENTSLITYFSKDINANTTYLSLTRGDGGQNLIGAELGAKLGLIRTQELLNARKIDGGHQWFTRAIDFGFSKTPEETLQVWDKDQILSDVVWAIRKHRPDVIINRFDHRTSGNTHGHHTSSALLSMEAFDLAADKQEFPSQLQHVKPWQPKRSFFNTSWWFYGSEEAFKKADKTNFIELDINTYYPLQGLSNNEISALSRSQHQSQGFGNIGSRGEKAEYIEFIKGEPMQDKNPFSGIDTSWKRNPEGEAIGLILGKVEKEFDFKNPWKSVPQLLEAKTLIEAIEDNFWRDQKRKEIKTIIEACLGLFVEARTEHAYTNPGENTEVTFEFINRSPELVELKSVTYNNQTINVRPRILNTSINHNVSRQLTINSEENFTTPYWLKNTPKVGLYTVEDQNLIGLPETPKPVNFTFQFEINGTPFQVEKPLVYKYQDPVKGEVYQDFEILPKASLNLDKSTYIFKNSNPKTIEVSLKAYAETLKGRLKLDVPKAWKIEPKHYDVTLKKLGEQKTFTFEIQPNSFGEVDVSPLFKVKDEVLSHKISTLAYDHIGTHTFVSTSKAKLVNLNLNLSPKKIAYVVGAGSSIPSHLEDIGYEVAMVQPKEISKELLSTFEVVIMGIRAYNIHDELKFKQDILFQFVEDGGTLIVQYNKNRGLKTQHLAPYPMQVSRDRVTEEDAEVSFINPKHPLLNSPNKIEQKDFEGWVQERGLYFPDQWSQELTPVLAMADQNESPKLSSILHANYGKGNYIYTGLSFFRELPAGVAGAFKLLVNLISID